MGMFHPDLAPFSKPEHPEVKKLTVICHLCGIDGVIGFIDTETIALPLKGHMFASPAPERGVDPFFAPDADWENMWCKWGPPNAVDGHHPFPPTKVLTKEKGWYEPEGSSQVNLCPLCKVDGVDSILEADEPDPDKLAYTICPIHGEREFKAFFCEWKDAKGKVCGKEYESQKALSGHMKAHTKKKGKKEKHHGIKRTGRKTRNSGN